MEEINETPDVQAEETTEQESVDNTEVEALKKQIADQDEKIKNLAIKARNAKKEAKETDSPKEDTKSDGESKLLEKFDKLALKTEGITDEDEVELANKLKAETGKDMEDLLGSKYFQSELQELRDAKATTKATSGVKGGGGESKATNSPAHWLAKGVYPTREQVPDTKARRAIKDAFIAQGKGNNKKFYNE